MSTREFNLSTSEVNRPGLSIIGSDKHLEISEFCTIGRLRENTVFLNDPFVSGRHCRIEKKKDQYVLEDLESRNGTYLNGSIIQHALLKANDRIKLGKTELIFGEFHQLCENHEMITTRSRNLEWQRELSRIPYISRTNLPVLITGPSGAGKEVLARMLHEHSGRCGSFVSVNCSALSEALIESELFGHLKGSFTGASSDRKGAFECAREGSLFLDEIGDLPLALQPKLLRALEYQEIRPVGSDKNIHTDVRIIAATHQQLKSKISSGTFREDLYFRLNVVNISPPALKDRMEDFDSLIYYFAKEFRVRFSFAAIEKLKTHSWPGNVRELKNVVARASAFFPHTRIDPEHLPQIIDAIDEPARPESKPPEYPVIKTFEKELIVHRLKVNRGNQRKTALELGIPKSTLHDRIRNYNINVKELKVNKRR